MRMMLIAGLAMLPATAAMAQVLNGPVGAAVGATAGAAAQVPGADVAARADTAARTAVRAPEVDRVAKADAGASVRVDRGTRCHHEDDYYAPTYRDGYYSCERTGSSAGVAARVRSPY